MSRDNYDDEKSGKKFPSIAGWAIALVVELIAIICMLYAYANIVIEEKYEELDVVEISSEALVTNEGVEEAVKGYTQIALFGLDARDESLGSGNRSDSIMVVSINNDTKEIKVASIYRDTLLEIEKKNPITSKINAAYAYGGPDLAVKTLNANLDLAITEYVSVNWVALTKAIDALGGVTVHVESNELDTLNMALAEQIATNGIYSDGVFETGDLLLNGAQATAYARIRSTGQGDITRTERQREVLQAMVEKAKKSDIATINKVIDEVFPYVSTSITKKDAAELAASLMSYNIVDTVGFPIQYQFYDGGEAKGSCIAPQDLRENVIALHRFLFDNEDYSPSEMVNTISDRVSNETGWRSNGSVLLPSEMEQEE